MISAPGSGGKRDGNSFCQFGLDRGPSYRAGGLDTQNVLFTVNRAGRPNAL